MSLKQTQEYINDSGYKSLGSFKNDNGDLFLVYTKLNTPFIYITGDIFDWQLNFRLVDKESVIKEVDITASEWEEILKVLKDNNFKLPHGKN